MSKAPTAKKHEFTSAEARDKFILSNGGLGVSIANKNSASVGHHGLEFEDLLQAAWVAIVRSSDYYDPEHAKIRVGFDNYAFRGVSREVQRAAINQVNAIVVGDSPYTKKSRSLRSKQTSESLAVAKQARTISLDFQPAGKTKPPDEVAAEREQVKMLLDALGTLPAIERWIVMSMYGIGCEPQTLEAIGNRLGRCRERVRQIKVAAMDKLRVALGPIGNDL